MRGMQLVQNIPALSEALRGFQHPAFVPTMGNLHMGHRSLVREAAKWGDGCVVSIFVNRLQFLAHEDFDRYPRTFEDDLQALSEEPCDVVFAPSEHDLYPEAQTFRLRPDPGLAEQLEGVFRPGFFEGVSTVVLKLFLAVFSGKTSGTAVFGKKDYQQWRVIEAMVRQFALPINVVACDSVREEDGLAMSSRNRFLDPHERQRAGALFASLCMMRDTLLAHGEVADLSTIREVENQAMQALRCEGWDVDYLCFRRSKDLGLSRPGELRVALGAARLKNTRLIDSLEF